MSPQVHTWTVVLADDHAIWRDGVRADLGDDFRVVGEAATAGDAIEVVRATGPDVVVCDLAMPGGGGLAVARACGTQTRIVMLTVSQAERDLLDAVAAERWATWSSRPRPRSCERRCDGW